jgi:FMN-dependent NADH-azoreductase
METLLVINSSGRVTRSITRRLTQRFSDAWQKQNPAGKIIQRDVGRNPPAPVDEGWITAAFAEPARRTLAMHDALRSSETLIEEIIAADVIVVGAPIYNFGMPAQLKAFVDQIIRVGRTFDFVPGTAEPYRPLLASKPVLVISSAGDGALHPGGTLAHLNFLEPHLETVFRFIGLIDITFVRVGYDEFQDERLKHSLAAAETALDEFLAGHMESRRR